MRYRLQLIAVPVNDDYKKYSIPSVRFRLRDYNSREEAMMFNDQMCLDGVISVRAHRRNQRRILKTKGVFRFVKW